MILYHGSFLPVERPKIIRSQVGRDFGCAFYVTDIQLQAERWAIRKTSIERRNGRANIQPTISVFSFDIDYAKETLKFMNFPDANLDWLEMVLSCRANPNYSHGYDIVSGKIADDNVGATVTFVQMGIMRKEDALERLKFQKINSQIAFCTETSLQYLSFKEIYHVEEGQQ